MTATPLPNTLASTEDTSLVLIPLGQLLPSHLNPRKHFDEPEILELAASIRAKGLLQNLIVRPHPEQAGFFEIVAGERRYRALKKLEEQGDPISQTPVLCRVQDLSDRDLLEIATAENFARKDMTPLEECEAFGRLFDMGLDVPELSLRFGFDERNIGRKVEIAKNLIPEWKERLDAGSCSLTLAEALCLGNRQTQKNLLNAGVYYQNPKNVRDYILNGKFIIKLAKFDLKKYKGGTFQPLYDDIEPYFEDKEQALALQVAWAEEKAEKLRKKDKHDFVEVEQYGGGQWQHDSKKYSFRPAHPDQRPGFIYLINTATGEVEEITNRYRPAVQQTPQAGIPEEAPPRDPYNKAAHLIGHQMRAVAYRQFIQSNPRQAVIHAIIGLLEDDYKGVVRIRMAETHHLDFEREEVYKQIAEKLGLKLTHDTLINAGHLSYNYWSGNKGNTLYDTLNAMTLEEVLQIFAALVAPLCADWSHDDERTPPFALTLHIAKVNNLSTSPHFKLTETFLKACNSDKITEIAQEAGVAAELGATVTKREKIQKLLTLSERLHREGYVPKIAGFGHDEPAQTELPKGLRK